MKNDDEKTQAGSDCQKRLVHPSEIAAKMKDAVNLGSRMINILDLRNAHMEGRIRFYLDCVEGKHPAVDLAQCIREDLKRLESDRSDFYGMNSFY